MAITQEKTLVDSFGVDFFTKLEEAAQIKVPNILQNILLLNDVDCAQVLSRVDDEALKSIETFMKDEFTADMVCDNQSIDQYLGKYSSCQNKFKFSSGHKIILKLIIEHCANMLRLNSPFTTTVSKNIQQDSSSNKNVNQPEIDCEIAEDGECFEQPREFDKLSFFRYIGSLIIIVFNDAKRLSLSGWSWPSRHFAAEKAHNFKVSGNPGCNPTLHYVTSGQYTTFLDSIVKSDIPKFVDRLTDSLALSLRVDGSVDRTQDHNIYVMGHMVNKDASVSTVFIGFDVPTEGKGQGVFNCIKSVVTKILPWVLCLNLISSLVTDGEKMNLGNKTGIHVKFLNEIRKLTSSKNTMLLIWCVAHRFNLAWTDLCKKFGIIDNVISDAAALSSHFHKSGERTMKLNQAARATKLSEPLRYPKYFPVRWTQYTSNLFNVALRNWRAAMSYFISQNETGLERYWLVYSRLHLIAFLADILHLLKTFQKTFESDIVSILDVPPKKQKLMEKLQSLLNEPMDDGWEKLFLSEAVKRTNDCVLFYGHVLSGHHTQTRQSSTQSFFDATIRKSIIRTLIELLNDRLDYDSHMQEALQPLASITSTVSSESLKLCYKTIIPDLDETSFYADYAIAANLLKSHEFKNALDTLQKLQLLAPQQLTVLKIALARIIAAKPHSADVERLISEYNKVKTSGRSSICRLSLFIYLYIKLNMTTLDKFDPTYATNHWLSQKNRRPSESQTRKNQEYFKGVFSDADCKEPIKKTRIVSF